ncbi:MAG: GNAT family N-acetyltransferase/peptidase C39 family protein [Gammaproteobacteria bacterium]|nr:GNAT family N-acetyltransferase/peptidase C39 family protein [Gammaproteobacteria bacterium]
MQNKDTTSGKSIEFISATIKDLDDLDRIEKRCFKIDRMSRRNLKHMIQKGNCDFILARQDNNTLAYILVLYHRGTHLARVYSLAVLPETRGQGLGELLLQQAENLAASRDCIYMRLEVHPNNTSAIRLYQRNHYVPFGLLKDYYEDHADALRYQKRILYREDQLDFIPVPYYQQTTDFTCGPASLIMAMQALDNSIKPNRTMELQLWREATTIFMTSGHGGCSPPGLALAAWRREFQVELWLNSRDPLFLDGVRSEAKKEVMSLVHEDFMQQVGEADIKVHYETIGIAQLEQALKEGGVALVLISSYSFTRSKAPHWVVVSGIDDTFVYIHDPEVDEETYRSETDNIYLPVARDAFNRSFRFGQSGLRAAVILYRR